MGGLVHVRLSEQRHIAVVHPRVSVGRNCVRKTHYGNRERDASRESDGYHMSEVTNGMFVVWPG